MYLQSVLSRLPGTGKFFFQVHWLRESSPSHSLLVQWSEVRFSLQVMAQVAPCCCGRTIPWCTWAPVARGAWETQELLLLILKLLSISGPPWCWWGWWDHHHCSADVELLRSLPHKPPTLKFLKWVWAIDIFFTKKCWKTWNWQKAKFKQLCKKQKYCILPTFFCKTLIREGN